MGTTGLKALTYFDGDWRAGNPAILGATSHASWLSSVVFDGARSLARRVPDLDRHVARLLHSAQSLGLQPMLTAGEILEICWEGITRFDRNAELYIRPMFFAESGFLIPDPESTRFALTVWLAPLPDGAGFSAGLTRFRRPSPETAPTDAKASCLYPNVARALRDAQGRGFDTAIVLDPLGNVAEFAYTNLFLSKDGTVHTPIPNGTFLNGITRQRVIELLRRDGVEVVERSITLPEVLDADEVFATGNYAKLQPAIRVEDRLLQPGPFYTRARRLYFDFVESCLPQ